MAWGARNLIFTQATRAQAILEDVRAEAAQAPAAGQTWLGLLHLARTKPAVRRMLLVGVGTAVAQQLSGTDALFYNYVKAADADQQHSSHGRLRPS